MATPAAILNILVTADTAQANAALAKTQGQLKATAATAEASTAAAAGSVASMGKKMTSVGGSMQKFGKTMTTHVGLPLLAVGAYAVKSAVDFNKSMTMISTQAGATGKEVTKLSKAVLAFAQSGKTAFDPKELSEALYHIESVGYRGAKAMKVLRASSKLASVGGADLEATTYGLISAMKTGITGTENMGKAIGALNAIVGHGDMKFEELTSSLRSGILVTGKRVGISLEEVGAALDIMTEQGIPAANASTALNMGLLKMTVLSSKAKEVLGEVGIGASQLANVIRKEGLPAGVELLQKHLQGLSKTKVNEILTEAFSVKSGKAIGTLVNAGEGLKTKLEEISGATGEVNQKWKETQQTPAFKLAANLSQLKATMTELGNKLLPLIVPLLKEIGGAVRSVIDSFNKLPNWTQSWLIKLSLAAIAFGPIIGALGTVIKLAGSATTALAGMGTAQAVSGTAGATGWAAMGATGGTAEAGTLATLATGLSGVVIPVGIGVGIAALTAALMNNGDAFDEAHSKFESMAKGLDNEAIPAWKRSRQAVKDLGEEMFKQQRNPSLEQTEARTPGLAGTLVPHAAAQSKQVAKDMKAATLPVREARAEFQFLLKKMDLDQLAGLAKLNSDLVAGLAQASEGWKKGTQPWRAHVVEAMKGSIEAIKGGMEAGAITAEAGRARIKQILAHIRIVQGSDPLGFAKGVQDSFAKAGAITQKGIQSLIQRLAQMPPKARHQAEEMVLGMAQAWADGHPKIEHQVEILEKNLNHRFGATTTQLEHRIRTGTHNMSSDFGNLASNVGNSAEAIQGTVQSMLDALNIQHTVSFAVQHGNFAAAGIKPKGEARGGLTSMVPGNGPGDHHLLSLDGTPVARVESSEGIFVGNRNMMGALGAMNAAVPRRAKGGGLTEPQMSGPPPLSTIGQKSIHLMYQAAKKYVAKLGGDKSMAAIVKNANRMDSLHQPYLWGGGHGSSASTGGPWDCSGAISELFNGAGWHFAPMVSGGFSSWGLPGRGKVSVLSNPEHVYAVIGNRAFGTSEENPGGGAGWISGYTYRSGFNTTHADLMNPMAAFHGGKRGKGQKAKHGLAAGGVVGQVGAILARNGLDRDAIAGILGNAFGESGYNPAAQESESAGGLWGFTAGAKSLASLKAYAAKIGVPWTNVKAQTQFMLHNFTSSERSAINALSGTDATTKWFMENWERPESMSSLGKRQSAAASALGSLGGTTASKAEKKIPASKRQKHTIGALQHRGAGVLKEAQQLKGQFKKYGGTKRGKLALERALKLAKEIKQAVKVGDTSRAKSLITKYRSVLGKARGSLKSAGEGVFTPGLKAAALPPLATSAFVAGQPFSEANLPGFAELPEGILKALKSPGLKAAGQYGVLEGALTMAGQTETKTDDAAVYNAMLGIAQGQKKGLKKRLAEVNKKLKGGGLTKAAREKLKETQGNILTALGTTQGRIVSAREGIAGLNEGEEEEKKEREEALIAATTELAQTQKGLADELRETRELSESAIATGSEVAWRALADKLSGNLGVRVITNSRTAGIGTVGRS